jgi:hypothetical protein
MEAMMMMMTMMMTFFYRGIGTKCTEHQILVTRNPITDHTTAATMADDDGRQSATKNKNHNNTNTNSTTTDGRCQRMMTATTTASRAQDTIEPTGGINRRHQLMEPLMEESRTEKQGGCSGDTPDDTARKTNQEGRMTMMWTTDDEATMIPSATGTLDRKTSQASQQHAFTTTNTRHEKPSRRHLGRWQQMKESPDGI